MTIKQVIAHKWVTHFNKNPTIPLDTSKVLNEEKQNWNAMAVSGNAKIQSLMSKFQDTMSKQLAMMRVNDDVQIKNLNHTTNPLLEKRKNRVKPAATWSIKSVRGAFNSFDVHNLIYDFCWLRGYKRFLKVLCLFFYCRKTLDGGTKEQQHHYRRWKSRCPIFVNGM